ncbi:MAG UNVERIFIED_CONTAM: HAMP domain-containing histidine kinase [Rickettsiaceae bacterium]|jgi:signal transduction histidine kinase
MFFIKTYASHKKDLKDGLKSDTLVLENFLHEQFEINLYALSLLQEKIKTNPYNLEHIHKVLFSSMKTSDASRLFSWGEFFWLDSSFKPRVSTRGIIHTNPMNIEPQLLSYIKSTPNSLSYWADFQDSYLTPSLRAIIGVNGENNKFLGAVVVDYDVMQFHLNLSRHKIDQHTGFILIDRNYRIITQSKPFVSGVQVKGEKSLNKHIREILSTIDMDSDDKLPISYVDMISGENYYIKKIEKLPFIVIVSVDKDEIKSTIFTSVIMKFLEISIFGSMFVLLIAAIYKRETWLRSKAEKASQLALRANSDKSDFLAFAAHEIRSPLGFIMTGSEIMCKQMLGPLSDKYLEYLEGIYDSAKMILEFINDILDQEHILAGNFKIVEAPVKLSEIIDTAIAQNLARYPSKKVEIVKDIDPALPRIMCDARRIFQVVSNLLSNSIKYSTTEAKIDIIARISRQEVVLEIRDYGVGMTEDEVKIALTKYGTVQKTPLNLMESYGLGLAIVKLLLDAHEASFSVESAVNVGTKVTIIFPEYKLVIEDQEIPGNSNEQ